MRFDINLKMEKKALTGELLLLLVLAASSCGIVSLEWGGSAQLPGGELWSGDIFQIGIQYDRSPLVISASEARSENVYDLFRVKVRND